MNQTSATWYYHLQLFQSLTQLRILIEGLPSTTDIAELFPGMYVTVCMFVEKTVSVAFSFLCSQFYDNLRGLLSNIIAKSL